mgnify:CR=1 FL=1
MKKRSKKITRLGNRSYWLEVLLLCALLTIAVALWGRPTASQQQRHAAVTAVKKAPRKADLPQRQATEQRKASPSRQDAPKAASPSKNTLLAAPKKEQGDSPAARPAKAEKPQAHQDARQPKAPEPKAMPLSSSSAAATASREEYSVAKVSDGDTLVLKDDRGNMLTVRLYGIDAPEGRQSMGSESRANMQRIAKGKRVRIKRLYVDNYQRTVAIVFLSNGKQVDDLSLNERQVQDGMAWVYDFFCKSQECNTWKFEEAMAKTRKIGIWKNPAPTPPWQWRAIQNSRP